VRATEYHINALFTDSFLSESAFLVSNIPNLCLKDTFCPTLTGWLMCVDAVAAGWCCGAGTF